MKSGVGLKGLPGVLLIPALVCGLSVCTAAQEPIETVVEAEEVVCTYVPPGNGAGPMWCYGAPLIVRWGNDVFVSAMETGEDVPKLCNTRWRLFRRDNNGWQLQQRPDRFREREPCPLVVSSEGRLFLSVNPSLSSPGTHYGPCDPHLLGFSEKHPKQSPRALRPVWEGKTHFTDHSYRGIACDGRREEILLLNIDAQTSEQCWSFLDRNGKWIRQGRIRFPIRACYPQVALREGAAHVLAIGDIVEPNEEWRKYKRQKTGREWDYVFRRLFYTWTPDIARTDFAEPLELENLDATAGYIRNLDLWIDSEGVAHVLYLKMPVQSALLRDKFFPKMKIATSLEYAVVRKGQIVRRETLVKGGEEVSGEVPGNARFHATKGGNLLIIYHCSGSDRAGKRISENRVLQVLPTRGTRSIRISLKHPFTTFFTATERGGSSPSDIVDLFGTGHQSNTLRYARVRLCFTGRL